MSDSSKKKHTEEVPKKTKAKPSTSSDVKTETITVRMPNDTERTEKILATTCKVSIIFLLVDLDRSSTLLPLI